MVVYATATNRHIWECDECAAIDGALHGAGYTVIDLEWELFDLLPEDTDHFTWNGFCAFAQSVCDRCKDMDANNLLIVSDSTIDYWNYNDDGDETGEADRYLIEHLRAAGISAHVDAVCGSGFVAMRDTGSDFGSRVNRLGRGVYDTILVIGGWNDISHDTTQVCNFIQTRLSTFARRLKV